MKISTRFLGEQTYFKREADLENFILTHPLILSSSEDAPENLVPVYIIGRQEKLPNNDGIMDLICLIWNPDLGKYQIWVYELKVYSQNSNDVQQLINYLRAIDENQEYRNDLIQRAANFVKEFLDNNIRGALCAQAFSDEVVKGIIDENLNRSYEKKLLAVKIYLFPVDNDMFALIEPFIGEERTTTGGRRATHYDDIPDLSDFELEEELFRILSNRKKTHPQRFEQLKAFLELFVSNPKRSVNQKELREEWQNRGLPKEDRGLSVSQVLGYKNNGALRKILEWDVIPPDIKDNYRLKDERYAEVLRNVLNRISKQQIT